MAASKSFAFEEREFTEASNAQLAPGSVPDFEAFGAIDLGAVSPAIGLVQGKAAYKPMSKGHEYVFDEEEKQRTFGEHLVFYTGAAYMSGIVAGTTLGVLEGAKKMKTLPNASTRLKVNAVVNACSKRAPTLGANLGVLALLFSINERFLCYARDKDDPLNPILGASLTGMIYRSTCGARACLGWTLAGGVGMSILTLTGQLHTLLVRQRFQDLSLPSFGGASRLSAS